MSDLVFRGHKATVVIELEMRNGATLRVPVSDLTNYEGHTAFDAITIPLGRPLRDRLYLADRDAKLDFNV